MEKTTPKEEKKTSKERKLSVSLAQAAFPVVFFANKFGIETISGEPLVHFGCVTENAGTLACFAAIFETEMLQKEKLTWGKFLGAIGGPSSSADSLFRCSSSRLSTVPMVNLVLWHRHGNSGEMRLYSISMGDIHESIRTAKDVVQGQAVAIIRCSVEMQQQLMAALLDRVYEK